MQQDDLKLTILKSLNDIQEIVNKYKQNELSVIHKINNYNDFKELFESDISEEDYFAIKELIDLLDYQNLETKLNKLENIVVEWKEKCEKNWNSYNINFKNHLKNKFNNILNSLNRINPYISKTDSYELCIKRYINFCDNILKINTNKDVLEPFSMDAKKYVIFGKNGAGKTRLLKHIKEDCFNSNSFIALSDREIRFGRLNALNMDYKSNFTLNNIFENTYFAYPNDVLSLFFKDRMIKELQKDETTVSDGQGNRNALIYDKLLKIYDSLGLDRKIYFDTDTAKIMLYNDEMNIKPYYVESGSDGEKSIIQLIMFILLCPENSFVFIDEPENHFNTALLNELFNILENERNDIIFIYCTHNIDFIELRLDAKLIYLEKFDGNEWVYNEFDSFEEISIENIINIVGTKKNILFIESEKEKLDYKLYYSLFDNYKVIPVSSCENVINNCKMLNSQNYLNLNREARGIIDNDFRTENEINKLKNENKIFTLIYSEIENMLLSPCILDYICEKYNLNGNIDKFKKTVIKLARDTKEVIINDYINKSYYKYQKTSKINFNDDINNIRSQIDNMNNSNKNDFIAQLEIFKNDLETTLNSENYDNIVKKYPNKSFFSCLNTLGINKDLYLKWVINSISTDIEFKEKINRELFDNFF